MRKRFVRSGLALSAVIAASFVANGSVTSAAANQKADCRPPKGPGDNRVHSGHIHVKHVRCSDARKLMLKCAEFSYGHSGTCEAVGRIWSCTSKEATGL